MRARWKKRPAAKVLKCTHCPVVFGMYDHEKWVTHLAEVHGDTRRLRVLQDFVKKVGVAA